MRPDDPQLADAAGEIASIYVHMPFCHRVCPYCDFTVVEGRLDVVDRYVDAVVREIHELEPWRPLGAVFVGGGTPSAVSTRALSRVLDAVRSRFGLEPDAEIGLEANPEDWTGERPETLRRMGFTRVSFGAQSLDPVVLSRLGRQHTPDDIAGAVAASQGWQSVSIDLIYGTPGESFQSWTDSVRAVIDLGVDHVSAYALTVEPGTELWRSVRSGAPAPDADDQADKWEAASELLSGAGFVRYEVSNYAQTGHHCRYNLAVWDQGEYAVAGVGAHGYRNGVRVANVRRLDTYLDRVERGLGATQSSDLVDGWSAEQERLMLGLRRSAGVRAGDGGVALVHSAEGRRLIDAGVLESRDGRLIVRRALLTDAVIRSVLDLPAP